MKKPNKRDTVNLFFSAFLVLAFIVCAHFFTQFTETLGATAGAIITMALYVVFGLLLFYATRVGEGKAIKRFSIITLILMVIVPLYILVASVAPGMPLHTSFASDSGSIIPIVGLASIALGYGIPYSFLSGFEIKTDDDETADTQQEHEVLEGGIEADILGNSDNSEEESEVAQENTEVDADNSEAE